MKKFTTTFRAILLIVIIICTNSYGQEKSPSSNLLFGQELRPESTNPDTGVIMCGSTEYEQSLQATDPKRMTDAQFEAWIATYIAAYKNSRSTDPGDGNVITIPVVVHVIYSGQAVGTAPNITDAQVLSQITVLNNDFRKLAGTPGANSSAVGADTMIQFALAKQDPNGNPTNGINHINMCKWNWSPTEVNAIVKPATIWDPTQYLNVWTVSFNTSTILGYAQFPAGSDLPGLPSSGNANTDGVVSSYEYFGSAAYTSGTFVGYGTGRTTTHEVGHWLGLRHIWGDSTCGTDYCEDTPTAHTANSQCNASISDCEGIGNEMVQNYMDYTPDTCRNIFTLNQKARMTVVMNNSVRRVTLKTSTMHIAIPLFANDAEVRFESKCPVTATGCTIGPLTQKITLFNRGTSALTSASISYTVNGGAATVYNWAGNLATDAFETIDMPVSSSLNGPMVLTVVNANGVADQRSSNNVSGGIYVPDLGTHTSGQVVMRLQMDNFGSQTSWTLATSEGYIIYSGGPYTDIVGGGPLVTETWNLPVNSCYKFLVYDTASDGICCENGNGFYDIRSADGTIGIISGSQFGSNQEKFFSITNNLSNDKITFENSIQVSPNPTKAMLNINVSPNLDLPTSYKITNALGQTITTKTIFSESDLLIDTSTFATGIYFIRVEKNLDAVTLRFIKE